MKRNLVIGLALLASIGLSLAAFGYWCIGTTAGAHWLIDSADDFAGIEMTATELEGSLLNGLVVRELRVAWEDGEIQVGDLKLIIRRINLLSGHLAIEDLEINRLVLQLDEDTESSAATDDVPGAEVLLAVLPNWLDASIDQVQLSGFVYRSSSEPDDEVVIADLIAGRYLLANQRLVSKNFSYHSPYVELDGEFDWQLALQHLVMTASVYLPEKYVDPMLFDSITVPTRFPGHIELDGDWNLYTGPASFGIVNEEGDEVWLTARATGSWRDIRIDDLKGRYLGGAIAGDLALSWIDSYRMDGQLSVHELNPSTLIKGTTGKASLDLSGELLIPYDEQPLLASLIAVIHESHFRGHPLQGRAAGQWTGQELIDLDVDLTGDGAHLLAKGVPAQRVDVDLKVADLAMYHKDLAGQATASGWLSWSENSLTGEIDGYGEGLAWQRIRAQKIEFQGRHRAGEESLSLSFSGDNWNRDDLYLKQVNGELSGTLADHRIALAAEISTGHYTALANGNYQSGIWTGRLEQLTGDKTPWGRWSILEPSVMTWDDGVVTVDELSLVADEGAQLTFEVDSWGSSERASAALSWTGLDLKWLQPYTEFDGLAGQARGQVEYIMVAEQPLSISGQIAADGQISDDLFELAYENLRLEFGWDQNGLQLTGMTRSDTGEMIQARANAPGPLALQWPVEDLVAELQWQKFNLSRLNRFMQDTQAEGTSEGNFSFAFDDQQLAHMEGHLSAQARLLQGQQDLGSQDLLADLSWNAEAFQCTAKISTAKDGRAELKLTSTRKPDLSWPDSGRIELKIEDLDLAIFETFLPQDVDFVGALNSDAEGYWAPAGVVDLDGEIQLLESRISYNSDNGQVLLPLREAAAEWSWSGNSLDGTFDLNLADHGDISGSWQLPLPARIPTAFDHDGQLQIMVDGKMQAIGILSAIGPWLVQDLHGETQLQLAVHGTIQQPDLRGHVLIKDGSAYLPSSGIQLEDIQLQSELAGDRLRIDRLSLRSGDGDLTGRGDVIFDRWQLSDFSFEITGKDFQVADFPELQVTISPDLHLSGTPDRLSLHGSTLIPKLAISGSQGTPEVLPSKDVVITKVENQRQELKFATDIQVTVELGDDVTVKSAGVDTRLAGGGILTMGPTGELLARGEIKLVSGSFRSHGVNLKIRQGVLNYQDEIITNPDLKIFAAREVSDVLAGVHVTGNAESPVVTLYSQPAMPERDILGYMLMGRAFSTEDQENDMLMMGAGSLMPSYGDKLSELGITEIDIQGLFSGTGGLRLRRKIAKQWEVESNLGEESGVDLYYIIELK